MQGPPGERKEEWWAAINLSVGKLIGKRKGKIYHVEGKPD